ncbi:hypothetical protein CEXT_699941 [Caerostris extrusa]|uniref:Uncharacterized protein n=1 Tax=Caerostris extrusa TaxID=172846 RepID=A0AAV4UIW0_CAEEX|nr:hypothetical protein CEXT_699941 [Caerostris extrusa]
MFVVVIFKVNSSDLPYIRFSKQTPVDAAKAKKGDQKHRFQNCRSFISYLCAYNRRIICENLLTVKVTTLFPDGRCRKTLWWEGGRGGLSMWVVAEAPMK